MKAKIILFIFFLILSNHLNAQDLNLKMIEQIGEVSFVSIDEVMQDGYNFKKIKEENNGKTITYVKGNPDNFNEVIIFKVHNTKGALNTLDVSIGENYNLKSFKDELIENNYLYQGTNKQLDMLMYANNKMNFLISKELEKNNLYRIIFLSE